MSSLKMTFSLASLVLLFAFVAMPVMAHVVPDPASTADPNPGIQDHMTTDTDAHPVVKSVTLKGDAVDGYVGGDSFLVDIVFEAANATKKISVPTHDPTDDAVVDVSLTAEGFTVVEILKKSDTLYEARLRRNNASETVVTIEVAASNQSIFTPGPPATGDDPRKPTVTYDGFPPMLTAGTARPLSGASGPLNNQWSTAFDVVFTITDGVTVGTEDAPAIDGALDGMTFELTAVPDTVTFSNKRWLGGTTYAATVTPKTVKVTEKAPMTVTITATIKDMAGNTGTGNATAILAKRTAGPGVDETPTGEDPVSVAVPAKSYVIVARTATPEGLPSTALPANTAKGSSATTIKAWGDMPNLEDLFFQGGSLLLTTLKATELDRDGDENATPAVAAADQTDPEAAKERDVLITEIMAARNTAKVGVTGYLTRQWIELYNNLPVPVTVKLSQKSLRSAPTAAATEIKLDLVSNVVNPGWDFTGLGADGVDDGDPLTADLQPFVSFYRKERGKNGHTKGHWTTSTDTYFANHKGTPGALERSGSIAVGATAPTYNVVINEIGNYSNDAYDWIELRNVNSGDGNLKKWQLWEITGDKAKSTILNFPDNDDHKIGAVGSVLLIVATDPYSDPNHPLAAGINITKDNGRVEKTGLKSRYYVAGTDFKLANSGKTLLLLRSRNDGGDHEGIVDLTGTHFIQDQGASFATDVWPLKGQTKGNDNHGHGTVIKGQDKDHQMFEGGFVYQRINAGRGTGKEVWERKGYTGVGYKRGAASTAQHGGTPGYDNGAVKVNEADLADSATVSISELMYARGNNLPQWIELYNGSMTQAVNLAEWKLKIEHSRDVDDVDIRFPSVTTNNLGGTIIQPNQTVLIVSNTTGRVSRGAQGGRDFPSTTRVVDLWKQKGKLEVDSAKNRRTYSLLSQTAFKITLMDKGGTAVDTVGNFGADPAWELPMAEDGEGRSSIIRRYDEGVPRDGTMAPSGDGMGAWVLASESNLAQVQVNETYYGSPDDVGTPGYRGGGPLPVSLSKFRPERLDSGEIVVRWITESELNNAGFNILRSETRDGEFTKLNTKLIAGQGTTSERNTYSFPDTSAKPNVVYYYQIQDVSLDGQVQTLRTTHLRGNVTAAGKLTTIWGELKALQ